MATMGVDTATNIAGNVKVHDGVLVLDGLSFDTPAARMQLTAIYRTPQKESSFSRTGLSYARCGDQRTAHNDSRY